MFVKRLLLVLFCFLCYGYSAGHKTLGQQHVDKALAHYDKKLGIVDTEEYAMFYDQDATASYGITDVYRGRTEIKKCLDLFYHKHNSKGLYISEVHLVQDRAVNDHEWVFVMVATTQFIPKQNSQCPVSMKVIHEAHVNRHTELITHSNYYTELSEEEFVTRMNTCQKMLSKQQVLDLFNRKLRHVWKFDTLERMKAIYDDLWAKDAVVEFVVAGFKLVGLEQIYSLFPAINNGQLWFGYEPKSYVIVGNKMIGEFVLSMVPKVKLSCSSIQTFMFVEMEWNTEGKLTLWRMIAGNEELAAPNNCVKGTNATKFEL